jgi:hypothetical protein
MLKWELVIKYLIMCKKRMKVCLASYYLFLLFYIYGYLKLGHWHITSIAIAVILILIV